MGRKRFIKFLSVILDECISWKDHIRAVENKIAKYIGLSYRAKQLLNTGSLKCIYFSNIHTYLNLRKHYLGKYTKKTN